MMPELSHAAGQIISYLEMCPSWSTSLQKGMNFHLRSDRSVVLMSRRFNAPYRGRIEQEGRVLIYEGHDVARTVKDPDPKSVDTLSWKRRESYVELRITCTMTTMSLTPKAVAR